MKKRKSSQHVPMLEENSPHLDTATQEKRVVSSGRNAKKRKGAGLLILTVGILSLSGLGGGYLLFLQNQEKSVVDSDGDVIDTKSTNNISIPQEMTTQEQKMNRMTSEELAVQKNIQADLERKDGKYSLVAVIEGQEANARLTKSLQVVGNQRQLLAKLHQELSALPKDANQQRELIAGRVNQLESRLGQNLIFLRRNYGYSLQQKYLLVPEEASLVGATSEGKRSVVHEFKKFEDYQDFQSQRDGYLRQLAEAVSEISGSESEGGENAQQDSKEILAQAKETPALRSLRKVLSKEFSYDPDKDHQVQFEKAGLYVQVTRNQN